MNHLEKRLWINGALLLGLAIILGAFGAHAIKQRVDAQSLAWWETASSYHRVHALGLFALAALSPRLSEQGQQQLRKIALFLVLGIVFFSGSLYIMTLTQLRILGAITPVGGSLWIIAWLWLARILSQDLNIRSAD